MNKLYDESSVSAIASAIRSKLGVQTQYTIGQMADAVSSISTTELNFRDKTIIPDKYNTGCHGYLEAFDLSSDTSGLHYNTPSGNLELKFNTQYSSVIRDVDPSHPIIYRNLSFAEFPQFQFMQCGDCHKEDANYTAGVVIIFENCLFRKVYSNSSFTSADMIQFKFINCTMEYFNVSNSILVNCLIGNKTFYKSIFSDEVLEDGIGVNDFTTIANSYVMDIEPQVSASGSAHFDGIQATYEHTDYTLYNVRFECMNMPYSPKGGGWTQAVNFEHEVTNLIISNCIINGGGYYATGIRKGSNQTLSDNLIGGTYNSACYPSENVYQLTDGFATTYTDLYVSSCFYDGKDISIVCSNDSSNTKTLTVKGYSNGTLSHTFTFSVPACPTYSGSWSGITEWDDLPFDKIYKVEHAVSLYGIDKIECYDGNTKIRTWYLEESIIPIDIDAYQTITSNGTYNVENKSSVAVNVPSSVSGTVEINQNGTGIDVAQYAYADVSVSPNVGTKSITTNGTYTASSDNLDGYSSVTVDVPQYGKPVVPQIGTWQYKTTYQCGFIIIGKDDDPADSAMFVRMVNGYGYPVTLNSSQQWQNNTVNSDADTQYSTYPSYSYSMFPNGGTINQLNKLVLEQNRGEIAMHGSGDEKIWDSANLTGDVLDTYYETYTTGGGTKTKEEFKAAIMDKYASTDVAQGASILDTKRAALQSALSHWIYTIGLWGGNFDFIIDGINCGTNGAVATSSIKVDIQKNFMGDGTLTAGTYSANPYYIYRDSSGLDPSKIETDLINAYNGRTCIELFHHYYLDGTSAKWNNFKTSLDILTNYTRQNKIVVLTRKEFYDLGEFVEHPITSISISPEELVYPLNTEFTASDFNMVANLDNGTSVSCASDRILDLSNIDSSTAGIYTVSLEYRGFKANCSVTISNEVPTHYLLENYSASGESIERLANFGEVSPALPYESGKSYRIQFHFRAETTAQYSSHTILFNAPTYNGAVNWRSSTDVYVTSVNGITESDITIDITVNSSRDIEYIARCGNTLNTTIGAWTVTNGYVYEITSGGGE